LHAIEVAISRWEQRCQSRSTTRLEERSVASVITRITCTFVKVCITTIRPRPGDYQYAHRACKLLAGSRHGTCVWSRAAWLRRSPKPWISSTRLLSSLEKTAEHGRWYQGWYLPSPSQQSADSRST